MSRPRNISFTRPEQEHLERCHAADPHPAFATLLDKMRKARDPDKKVEAWPFKVDKAMSLGLEILGNRLVLPVTLSPAFYASSQKALQSHQITREIWENACQGALTLWKGDIYFETLCKYAVSLATRHSRRAEQTTDFQWFNYPTSDVPQENSNEC